ncbi:MAG: hypothetical protein OXD01_12785, partial [Gammaproteobacteria bacterium]|nr:hypothetical protein [Gammaproteobacteria bacterium]
MEEFANQVANKPKKELYGLADMLYNDFYSNSMDREDFDNRIGWAEWEAEQPNWAEIVGSRVADRATKLVGGGVEAVDSVLDAAEFIGSFNPQLLTQDKQEIKDQTRERLNRPSKLDEVATSIRQHEFKYENERGTSWDQLVESPFKSFAPFAIEEGIVSLPDMLAALANLPAYAIARTGEIAGERADNDIREDSTVGDFLAALPSAVASAALEKIGASKVFGITDDLAKSSLKPDADKLDVALDVGKRTASAIGRRAAAEGLTEAAQEPIEQIGASLGTERWKNKSSEEIFAELNQAAVQGGVTGALAGGGIASTQVAVEEYLNQRRNQVDKNKIDEEESASQAQNQNNNNVSTEPAMEGDFIYGGQGETRPERLLGSGQTTGQSDSVPPSSDGFVVTPEGETMTRGEFEEKQNAWKRPPSFLDTVEEDQRNVSSILMEQLAQKGKIEIVDPKSLQDGQSVVIDFGYDNPRKVTVRKRSNSVFEIIDETGRTLAPTISTKQQDSQKNPMLYSSTIKEYQAQAKSEDKEFNEMTPEMREEGMEMARLIKNFANNRDRATLEAIRKLRNSKNFNKMPEESRDIIDGLLRDGDKIFEDEIKAEKEKKEKEAKAAQEAKEKEAQEAKDAELAAERETVNIGEDIEVAWDNNLYLFVGRHKPSGKVFSTGRKRDSVLKAATDLANDPEAIDKVVKSTQKPAPTSKPKAEPKAEPKPKTASETFQENYRQLQTNFSAKPTKENFDAIDKLSADFDWTTVTEDEFNKVNDFLVANRPTFYPPDDTVDEGETEDQTQVDTSPQGILQTAKNLNSVIEDLDNTEIGSIENDEAAEQLESFIGSKEFSTLPDNVQTEIKAYSETGSGSIRSLYNLLEGKSPEDQPVVDDSVSNDKPIPSQQTRSEQKASKEQAEAIKAGKIGPRPPTMSGPGKKAVLLTHDEKKWKGKFALVSANDLLASTNTSGQLTPDYPEMLQPRNRADKQSLLQMSKIANKPNPLRLGDTNMASEGAPVVRSDGVVLSGNGRTAGLKEAYIKGNADKYKKWVLKQAKKFGINAKDIIKAGDMPVLVRVLGDYSIQEQLAFARDANESTILKESAGSQASIDAARIADANIIHLYAPSQKGEMNTASNRMFIGRALTAINRTDAVGNDGQITPEGERILNSAVFHMAYGDDRLTKMLAEETRPQNANIIKALRIVAGDFAKARAESPDFDGIDIAGALTEGIEIIQQAASRNLQVEEFLAQEDAFSEQLGYTPAGKLMANFMYENRLSAKKMIDAFGTMGKLLNEALAEKNQIQMPGLEPIQHTVESIIQATALRILETNEAGSESLSSGLSGAGSMFSDEDLQDSDTAMQEADASAFDLSASGSVQSTDQAEDTSPRPTKPLFQKKQVTTKDFWQEQAKSIYNKWNNSKSVKDSIENIIKNLAPWANIREMSEEFAEIADGAFDIIGGQAYIFYNLTAKNPTHSMHHEILHALREARLFTNEEWSKLSEMAVKEWIAKHNIEDRYPELFDDNGKPTEAAIEEAIAEEFADYAIKHLQKNNAIKKTFGKLFNFNTDMMKLLRGLGAVPETDAIFDKILSGEVTARHPSMQTKDVPVKNIPNPLKIKLTHNLSTQYLEKQIDEGFVAPSISIQMQNDANFFGLNKEDKHNDMYAAATVVFKPTALSWGQDPVFPGDAYTPMRGGSWDAFSYDEVAKRGLPNFLGDQRKVDLISMASDVYNMSISDNSIKKSEDGNFYFNTVNEKNKKTRRKVTDKNFNDVIIQAARDMIGLKSYNHLWEGLGRGQIRTIEQSKQVLATIANFGEEKSRVRGGVFLEAKPLKIIPATEVSYVVIGEKDYLMDDNDYKRMIDKLKRKGIDVVMAKDVDSLGAAQSRDDVLFQRMRQSFLPKLRAVHSIAEHKIIKSLQYEGLPAPSIAITPENVAHQWGDEKIDLVFKAGTVVPSRDDIATGDSWSVTHPTTQLMMAGTNAQKKAFIENVM